MTNARQFRARAIVEFSARQDLVRDASNECVEIAWQVFNQLPQHRGILALGKDRSTRRHRLFAKTCGLQNRQRIEARAFNTQSRNRFAGSVRPLKYHLTPRFLNVTHSASADRVRGAIERRRR